MKQERALRAYDTLETMGHKVTGQSAFILFKLKQQLKEIAQFQTEEEVKLLKKYEGTVGENGICTFKDPGSAKPFLEERRKLYMMECDIDPVEIQADSIPDINMAEIDALDGFVVFK